MTTRLTTPPKASGLPSEKWQAIGNGFVQRCETALWEKSGTKVLEYLSSLGLTNETVRKYRVGYNLMDEFGSLEDWGLPVTYNSKGNLSKIWLPRGIIVPCIIGNVIHSIKVRQYLTPEQPDYAIKGSAPSLFGAGNLWNVY